MSAWAAAVIAITIIGSAKPMIRGADAIARFEMQRWLFARGSEAPGFERKYNASLPVLAAPLFWLGRVTATGDAPEHQERHVRATVAQFNHVVLAALLAWLFHRLVRGAGLAPAQALAGVWITLVTSLALPHSRDFYSELAWSAALLVAIDALASARTAGTLGSEITTGVASAAAVWLNPMLAPIWALAAGAIWLAAGAKQRGARRALGATAAGITLGLALQALENWLERGHPLRSGYGGESFTFRPAGVWGLLISPGKGALFYLPQIGLLAVLARWRAGSDRLRCWARPRLAGAVAATLLLLVTYGSWWSWSGARYFGPRFLLFPSVLGSVVLGVVAAHWSRLTTAARAVVVALCCYCTFTTLLGLTVNQRYFDECTQGWEACHWSWAESPWWVFTKPPAEFGRVLVSRAAVSLAVGTALIAFCVRKLRIIAATARRRGWNAAENAA